jgi:N-acetylmuramoyl-L-alanine amidase
LQCTPHYTNRIMGNRQRLLVDAQAGVYRYDQLIVLRHTAMPAVLLEAGSIINRDEELLVGAAQCVGGRCRRVVLRGAADARNDHHGEPSNRRIEAGDSAGCRSAGAADQAALSFRH